MEEGSDDDTIRFDTTGQERAFINSSGLEVKGELKSITATAPTLATGGTISTSGGFTIHTFTSNGTFTPMGNVNIEYLVVGGGGAGASGIGGGGGAGGFRTGFLTITNTPKTVTVGVGGTGSTGVVNGGNGGDSIFDSITAVGGGGGGTNSAVGVTGGSGGGSGSFYTLGSAATAGQGNAGGAGVGSGSLGAGGGGGAGNSGANATPLSGGGNGGAGQQSSISGIATFYAAGGGGGANSVAAGAGGSGGGGAGGISGVGTAGTANTGSGGGGNGNSALLSAAGGSGIVIIRYLTGGTQFHVDGDGVQTLRDGSGDTGTVGQVLSSTGTQTNWVNVNRVSLRTVTGNASIAANDGTVVLRANATAAVTLTLPVASSLSAGNYYIIKRLDNGATPTTVTIAAGNGIDTIDGNTNTTPTRLNANGDVMTLQTDGVSAWYIISE